MKNNKDIKIIISGGGTGGHVFPAIAIADALRKRIKDINILFVGAKGKMEMKKVVEAGYLIEGLWISGLQRSLSFKNISVPFKIISSLFKSNQIIKYFKPDVVIGVGGYASWAIVKVATMKGIPTLIQEQNSFPGKSNINLSKKADKICVAFEGMEKYFPKSKIVITGNPVRNEMVDIENKREDALKFFGFKPDRKMLFAVGGSLGALTINESIKNNLELFEKENIQLIWQTGKSYFEVATEAINKISSEKIKVFDFINRMDFAYAATDIVVSRAGAIAVSELCNIGKPVILVPSPNVAEDHQTKNARALVKTNAAILIKDSECRMTLGKTVIDLIKDEKKCTLLKKNIKTLAMPNAADNIANEVLSLVAKNDL